MEFHAIVSPSSFLQGIGCLMAPLLVLGPLPGKTARTQDASLQEASSPAPDAQPGPFLFAPGPGPTKVALPRAERLVYKASLSLGVAKATVGTVVQTCTVAQQEVPLMLAHAGASAGEAASIKLEAAGEYLWYSMSSTLETRILPQDWPRLYYQQTSDSSRGTRRREVMLGSREGAPVSSYRGDTSKGAPPGTRIWRAARERSVPEGTIDMLTAVFLARALIGDGAESLSFPLIDTDRLWLLSLRRGEERSMETDAGTFDAVRIVLEPKPYPGEPTSKKEKQFAGVFGIHGTIQLWVEKRTGIAVRIQGDLPIDDGLITLGIDVVLASYSGTHPEFKPLRKD